MAARKVTRRHYIAIEEDYGFCESNVMLCQFKGALSPIFSVTVNGQKTYCFNGRILLTITLLVHRNHY